MNLAGIVFQVLIVLILSTLVVCAPMEPCQVLKTSKHQFINIFFFFNGSYLTPSKIFSVHRMEEILPILPMVLQAHVVTEA